MSLFSSSKCVLLLNDDGVSVYSVRSDGVNFVDNVVWGDVGFKELLSDLISNRCGRSPVIFINDMVEQHYRKERVARASLLDHANLVKRRVAGVFPSYALRASLKLKEKAPVTEGQRAGDIYLFAAMPVTEGVNKAIEAVKASKAQILGFCLLPVESTNMVHALGKKLSRVGFGGTEWTIFAGQHRGGGLRQIVTKNGELALTRLTPVSSYESGVENWCHDLANELRGTMGYLSRFGFSPSDSLNVIVIGDPEVSSALSPKIDFDCDLNILTPFEAANMLGLRLGKFKNNSSDSHLADILHISSIAKKRSFIINLQNQKIENINQPIIVTQIASLALLGAGAFFAYESFSRTANIFSASNQIEIAKQELASSTQIRDAQAEIKKKIGLDFVLVERVTSAFRALESETILPLPAIEKIGMALGPDLNVKNVTIKPTILTPLDGQSTQDPAQGSPQESDQKLKSFDLVLSFVFPPSLSPDAGVQKIAELEQRLIANLPSSAVSIIKQVADLSYTGNIVGNATSNANAIAAQNEKLEAQILIRGPLQ